MTADITDEQHRMAQHLIWRFDTVDLSWTLHDRRTGQALSTVAQRTDGAWHIQGDPGTATYVSCDTARHQALMSAISRQLDKERAFAGGLPPIGSVWQFRHQQRIPQGVEVAAGNGELERVMVVTGHGPAYQMYRADSVWREVTSDGVSERSRRSMGIVVGYDPCIFAGMFAQAEQ